MSGKKQRGKTLLIFIFMLFQFISYCKPVFAESVSLNITTGNLFIYADGYYALSEAGPRDNLVDRNTVITSAEDLTITLADGSDVTIDSISVEGNLTLKPFAGDTGTGKLHAVNSTGRYGINTTGDITVTGGTLIATATAINSCGIEAKGNVNVSNSGHLEGSGELSGVRIDGDVAVSDGTLIAATEGYYGLIIYGKLQVSGGVVTGESHAFGVVAVDGIHVSGGLLKGIAMGEGPGAEYEPGGGDGNVSIGFTAPTIGIDSYNDIIVTGGQVWGEAHAGEIETVGIYIDEPGHIIDVSGGLLVGEARDGDIFSTSADRKTYGIYVMGGDITASSSLPDDGKIVAMTDGTGITGQPYFCINGNPPGEGVYDHKYTNSSTAAPSNLITLSIPNAVWPSPLTLENTDVLYRAGILDITPYTIAFDGNGGGDLVEGVPETVTNVPDGSTIAKPSPDPTRTGYNFTGWYLERDGGRKWDFATDPVTSSFTLYAHWERITENPNTGGSCIPGIIFDDCN